MKRNMDTYFRLRGMLARFYAPSLRRLRRECCVSALLHILTKHHREDITVLLGKLGSKLTVTLLLESLQQSLEFEAFVSRKYGTSVCHSIFQETHLTLRQLQEVLSNPGSRTNPNKSISSAFEKHMGVFVDAQDKYVFNHLFLCSLISHRAISDMMAAYRGSGSRPSIEGEGQEQEDNQRVLPSSGDLFYFYAQTLEQCAKFTTGRPLYDLFLVFKKWLRIYAGGYKITCKNYSYLKARGCAYECSQAY